LWGSEEGTDWVVVAATVLTVAMWVTEQDGDSHRLLEVSDMVAFAVDEGRLVQPK
jgi:hypothetical protein